MILLNLRRMNTHGVFGWLLWSFILVANDH
jgi:hypothetical protein